MIRVDKNNCVSMPMRRCLVSRELCPIDTKCPCIQCRAYLAEKRMATDAVRAREAYESLVNGSAS